MENSQNKLVAKMRKMWYCEACECRRLNKFPIAKAREARYNPIIGGANMNTTAKKTAAHYAKMLTPLGREVKLNLINALSASLLSAEPYSSKRVPRSFGMAKNKLQYPDNIDFCNDEIAALFGASE